eukprot:scaffold50070_cov112-Isochrysis_galbana.AAC.8
MVGSWAAGLPAGAAARGRRSPHPDAIRRRAVVPGAWHLGGLEEKQQRCTSSARAPAQSPARAPSSTAASEASAASTADTPARICHLIGPAPGPPPPLAR